MMVTVISLVIVMLGIIQKACQRDWKIEIRGQVETIQTTALWISTRTLRRVLDAWEDLLSLKLQQKPPVNVGEKNSRGVT